MGAREGHGRQDVEDPWEGREGSGAAKRSRIQALRSRGTISAEERWNMIAEAAYRSAEQREFMGGDPVEDWCRAGADIDARLAATNVRVTP